MPAYRGKNRGSFHWNQLRVFDNWENEKGKTGWFDSVFRVGLVFWCYNAGLGVGQIEQAL